MKSPAYYVTAHTRWVVKKKHHPGTGRLELCPCFQEWDPATEQWRDTYHEAIILDPTGAAQDQRCKELARRKEWPYDL